MGNKSKLKNKRRIAFFICGLLSLITCAYSDTFNLLLEQNQCKFEKIQGNTDYEKGIQNYFGISKIVNKSLGMKYLLKSAKKNEYQCDVLLCNDNVRKDKR